MRGGGLDVPRPIAATKCRSRSGPRPNGAVRGPLLWYTRHRDEIGSNRSVWRPTVSDGPSIKNPPSFKREVKKRDDVFLNFGFEVNQQVTATDQVQLGKRRIADQVLRRENDRIAQRVW